MTISFTKVRLPFGWLGNMSPHPLTDPDGIVWRTAEHLFQAMRFSDPTIRAKIGREPSPMTAKMVARSHSAEMMIVPQSKQDLDNMRCILRLKMHDYPNLLNELIKTGSEKIVEDVTKRQRGSANFWGAALVDGLWVGENTLGKPLDGTSFRILWQ